jgi:hypothetical protein
MKISVSASYGFKEAPGFCFRRQADSHGFHKHTLWQMKYGANVAKSEHREN